jgi:glycosyltransferase involved in cell wall biosynthesis
MNKLTVMTSYRAPSLKNVSEDIVKVARSLGYTAKISYEQIPSFQLRRDGSSAIIMMPVDPLYSVGWLLIARDCVHGNVPCIYYGVVEGRLNEKHVKPWMSEARIVTPSKYVRDKLTEAGLTVVGVVHHGVDLNLIEQARKYGKYRRKELCDKVGGCDGKVLCVTVSNSHPRKGLALLNRMANIVHKKDDNVVFYVVTEPKGQQYFNAPNVVVDTGFGSRSRVDALSLIAAADIYVSPSMAEGFGLTILDSMALGVPVVHAELPPLMEFSEGFTVPVEYVSYFDVDFYSGGATVSGIIYENHVYDVEIFAEVLLQVVDYVRSRSDIIDDYRGRCELKVKEYDINVKYKELLKYLGMG